MNSVCPSISDGVEYILYDPGYATNVDIVVMDSGIDASHPQLDDITIERIFDPAPNETSLDPYGTFVAGIIVGKDYGVFRAKSSTTKLLDVSPHRYGMSSICIKYSLCLIAKLFNYIRLEIWLHMT